MFAAISGTLRGAVIWSALLMLGAGFAARPDTVRRSFDVAPGGRLELESSLGAVLVETGDDDRIEIEVDRSGLPPRLRLEFVQEGDLIRVRGRGWGPLSWLPPWLSRDVRFRVRVPAHYEVAVSIESGSIEFERAAVAPVVAGLQPEQRARREEAPPLSPMSLAARNEHSLRLGLGI